MAFSFLVAVTFVAEIGDGSKHPVRDDVALDFGEPQLHLIQPLRVRGREVKTDVGMLDEKLLDVFGLMRWRG